MSSGNDKELRIGVTAETSGADEARRALEGVKRAAEEAAEASSGVKSMGDGGQPDTGALEAIEATTEAISEQVEANGILIDSLDELTDAEAGVVRSTGKVSEEFKKLSEEGKKPDGFAKLFSAERMEGIKGSFGELGKAVGDFAKEFAKTEEGQKLLEGLSDETKVFGETALSVAGSVAEGFATGGPIGGAVSGLAALVKHVAGEYLDAQQRIEASNRELEEAEAAAAERREERRKAATTGEIERTLEGEKRLIDDQNAAIKTQLGLWDARKENARSDLERRKAEAELRGEDTSKFDREKIDMDFRHEMSGLKGERDRLLGARNQATRAAEQTKIAVEKEAASSGRNNPAAKRAQEAADQAAQELADIERDLPRQLETIEFKENTANNRYKANLAGFGKDQRDRQQEASRRQQAEEKRREEQEQRAQQEKDRAREAEENRLRGIGREADGIAGQAKGIAEKQLGKSRGADDLGKIGDALRDDPTAAELKTLTEQLAQLAASLNKNGKDNSAINRLQKEVRDLQGKLTKRGDVSHT